MFFPPEPTEKKDKSTRQMGDYSDLLITVKGRLRAGFVSVEGPYVCPPRLAPSWHLGSPPEGKCESGELTHLSRSLTAVWREREGERHKTRIPDKLAPSGQEMWASDGSHQSGKFLPPLQEGAGKDLGVFHGHPFSLKPETPSSQQLGVCILIN